MSHMMLHKNVKKAPRGLFTTFEYTGEVEYDQFQRHVRLLTSGVLTAHSDIVVDVHLVGGGAAGAHTEMGAQGGNGGQSRTAFGIPLFSGRRYRVTIGAGGRGSYIGSSLEQDDGGGTIFRADEGGDVYERAYGGNAAASTLSTGSGGGGAGSGANGVGGDGGSDGSNGERGNSRGGYGQRTTTRAFGEADGELFSGGGAGTAYSERNSGYGGEGGGGGKRRDGTTKKDGDDNTGGGGAGAQPGPSGLVYAGNGGSGIVLIRKAVV